MANISNHPNHDLTEVELGLVNAVLRGDTVDLENKTVRAKVLRELILGLRPKWRVPDSGVRIINAHIDGTLDLAGANVSFPVDVWHSRITASPKRGAIILTDATVLRFGLHETAIVGDLQADRVEVERGLFVVGGEVFGVCELRGAKVDGPIAFESAKIGDGRTAILAAGLKVSGSLTLRYAKLEGRSSFVRAICQGGIQAVGVEVVGGDDALNLSGVQVVGEACFDRLRGQGRMMFAQAHIAGKLSLRDAKLVTTGLTLDGPGVRVDHGLDFTGLQVTGHVVLDGARIGHRFNASQCIIESTQVALSCEHIQIEGSWDLSKSKLVGALYSPGARVGGRFRLTEIRIFGTHVSLHADGIDVRSGMYLSRATLLGQLRIPASHIGDQLRLRGATLKVESGAALHGGGGHFRRDIELTDGCQSLGGVVLESAVVGGRIDFTGSLIKSAAIARDGGVLPDRPLSAEAKAKNWDEIAVGLSGCRCDTLVMPATADTRPLGLVDLTRAEVAVYEDFAAAWPETQTRRVRPARQATAPGDRLELDGFTYIRLAHPNGEPSGTKTPPASSDTDAQDAITDQPDERPDKALGRVRIPRSIDWSTLSDYLILPWEKPETEERPAHVRVSWLLAQSREDTAEKFKPQPWRQLSKVLYESGEPASADVVRIAAHRRKRRADDVSRTSRFAAQVLDLVCAYGYRPWRAVLWLCALTLFSASLYAWAATYCEERGCVDQSVFVKGVEVLRTDTVVDPVKSDTELRLTSKFSPVLFALDRSTPYITLSPQNVWHVNPRWKLSFRQSDQLPWFTQSSGIWLLLLSYAQSLLATVFWCLAILSFTGVLKKRAL